MTIQRLAAAFLIFSVLSFPVLWTYRSGAASSSKHGWGTLGNLGYNSVRCKNDLFAMGMFQLQCPYGAIDELKYFGVNPEGVSEAREACIAKPEFKNVEASAESHLDHQKINKWFKDQCKDKAECAAKFEVGANPAYKDPKTSTKGWLKKSFCAQADSGDCVKKMSKFFMQFTCTVTGDEFKDKYNKVALASACISFIAFCFGALVYYMRRTSVIDQ
jgi:hypothetical protein